MDIIFLGSRITPALCLMAGIALILFSKKHARVFMRTISKAKEKRLITQQESERLEKTGCAATLHKFYEIASIVLGVVLILISVPSFLPATEHAAKLMLIFLGLCIASACTAGVGTLLLWPLWGREVRRYMREQHFSYSERHQGSLGTNQLREQESNGQINDPYVGKLQKRANKYGVLCSIILFVIFLFVYSILATCYIL